MAPIALAARNVMMVSATCGMYGRDSVTGLHAVGRQRRGQRSHLAPQLGPGVRTVVTGFGDGDDGVGVGAGPIGQHVLGVADRRVREEAGAAHRAVPWVERHVTRVADDTRVAPHPSARIRRRRVPTSRATTPRR